jgi:hypothetical protein
MSTNLEGQIRRDFPGLAPFLDVPELKNLLVKAADQGWTADRFMAEVRGTKWWKTHTQSQQEWVTLAPAEQRKRGKDALAKMVAYEMDLYGTASFNKTYGSVANYEKRWWSQAIRLASGQVSFEMWQFDTLQKAKKTSGSQAFADEMQRQEELARQVKRPEEIAEQLWQQAHGDYFVNISKKDAKKWADNIIHGKSSFGEFDDFMRKTAATMYSGYADSINNGVLPKALFGPALSTLANELETSPDAVVANPKLWGEITAQAAGAKGAFTASDWIRYARALPEYQHTHGARELVANFEQEILQRFGAVA